MVNSWLSIPRYGEEYKPAKYSWCLQFQEGDVVAVTERFVVGGVRNNFADLEILLSANG